ncbi:galanin peptides isoform X1 [Thunnus maccoyii]|uniref:galanin peptides isoform X1 n=2 Tax=Thunnus TaxID=8234 RepID=UPI001C4BCC29|nr:galanin peptides isoform X1 [Thunnus maccoyii]
MILLNFIICSPRDLPILSAGGAADAGGQQQGWAGMTIKGGWSPHFIRTTECCKHRATSAADFREKQTLCKSHITKMQKCFGIFCVSLIFCATLSETIGLVIAAKEKRGWTLNSAGYLLGPRRIDHLIQIKDSPSARGRDELVTQYGIDGHRTLGDKPGLAGKRDMGQEEDFRTGALRIADEDIIHTIIDFLSYLKLKEMGALDSLPSSVTSDELANP